MTGAMLWPLLGFWLGGLCVMAVLAWDDARAFPGTFAWRAALPALVLWPVLLVLTVIQDFLGERR